MSINLGITPMFAIKDTCVVCTYYWLIFYKYEMISKLKEPTRKMAINSNISKLSYVELDESVSSDPIFSDVQCIKILNMKNIERKFSSIKYSSFWYSSASHDHPHYHVTF